MDMPLNAIPPTTTPHNLAVKLAAAQHQCWVDVGFYGGLIPQNCVSDKGGCTCRGQLAHHRNVSVQDDLKSLVQLGIRGFKCFMIDSGVDEFPMVSEDDIRCGMQQLQVCDIANHSDLADN